MTPQEQVKALKEKLIAGLCRTDERPENWLPHTVYVEEVGEDEELGEVPVYTRYTLEDYKADGNCTFRNMEGECRTGWLHEICTDWLIILWNRYLELCIDQDMWKDRAIHLLEHEPDASLPDILEFIEEHWQNCATDEEKIAQFREWIAPEKEQTRKKELYAFSWPCVLMERNVSDQEILAAYETEDRVEKLTPDEVAAEINDGDCPFGQCYVRFIETQ